MILESIGILVQGPKKSCIKATLLYGVGIRLQNKKDYSADYALFFIMHFPDFMVGGPVAIQQRFIRKGHGGHSLI